jgi:hypothetical protein
MAHAAMSNTQENGPGQDYHQQQASESLGRPYIQPASDGDSGCGGTTGSMDTMFDELRDAAAKHDGDCNLLPLVQDGAATSKQPGGGSPPTEAGDDTPSSDP